MTAKLKVTLEQEVSVSPEELAELWWSLDAEGHAQFFNHLALIAGASLDFQLRAVVDLDELNPKGWAALQTIGDYGHDKL